MRYSRMILIPTKSKVEMAPLRSFLLVHARNHEAAQNKEDIDRQITSKIRNVWKKPYGGQNEIAGDAYIAKRFPSLCGCFGRGFCR